MVKEPIEQRRGHHRVAKDVTPFGEAAIGGEDHGAALIAGVDELEEQIAAAGDDGQVSDFVDDQQRGPAQEANPLAQLPLPFGLGESADDVGKACKIDAATGLHSFHAQRRGEMALAGSGWAEEVDHLMAVDKVELGQRENAIAIKRRLEREVESCERLDSREFGHSQRHLDAAVLAQRQFLSEQGIDDLQRTGFAALELAHGLVQHL